MQGRTFALVTGLLCRGTIPGCGAVLVFISALGGTVPLASATIVYYSDYSAGTVYRTDGTTRTTVVSGLSQPMKIVLAGDGSFYVATQTGTSLRHFSAAGVAIGAAFDMGTFHTGLALGPDGDLYASSTDNTFSHGYVDRYNLAGNLPAPSAYTDHSSAQFTQFSANSYLEGLAFGPDGDLYASGNGHSAIDVYQGPGEASPGTLITSLTGAGHDYGISFGPDGHLYASAFNDNIVYRYDGTAFVPFATTHLSQPVDPVFGPDGNLYVTNFNGRDITRYQGSGGASPGAFIDVFASQANGNPSYMAIAAPEPASWKMIVLGGAGLLIVRCRKVCFWLRNNVNQWLVLCVAGGTIVASSSAAKATVVYYTQPFTNSVMRTDGTNTTTAVSGVTAATGLAIGPDGNLYISEEGGNKLDRFTLGGTRVGTSFGTGRKYVGVAFGADGLIYASSTFNTYGPGYLERFNPTTDAAAGSSFATSDPSQYSQGSSFYYEGIASGPDGNLYGAGAHSGSVDIYQGPFGPTPGALIRKLTGVAVGSDVAFGPDGAVYAGDFPNNRILRYDGTMFKAFASTLINQPVGIAFGPDGNLYVSNGGTNKILRFQGPGGSQPGALIDVFATTSSRPSRLVVVPEPSSGSLLILGLSTMLLGIRRKWARLHAHDCLA
jgi:sugar lactone lactonase YvrE